METNRQPVPLIELKKGETYEEVLLDETDDAGSQEEAHAIILHNSPNLLIVYLSGCYSITEEGKQNLLNAGCEEKGISDYLEAIPTSDYQHDDHNHFFNKYGFHDEAIIFYDHMVDHQTVDNDYVGRIQFLKP